MDPEVPRSSRGGGTITPNYICDEFGRLPSVWCRDLDALQQGSACRVKNHNVIVQRHHRIPPVPKCESRGHHAIGQGDRFGQANLARCREAGDKNGHDGYQATNHYDGQREYQAAQPLEAGR